MTSLEPIITTESETAADKVATLAHIRALKDVIGERESDLRDSLELQVRALSMAAGGQFTLRCDAGQAYIAGGNLNPRVADTDAFGRWLKGQQDESLSSLAVPTDRVDVVDHGLAAEALDAEGTSPSDVLKMLDQALRVTVEWRIATDALDTLTDRPDVVVKADGVYVADPETGEQTAVPGLVVNESREQLTVKPDKKVREALADRLREAITPALKSA